MHGHKRQLHLHAIHQCPDYGQIYRDMGVKKMLLMHEVKVDFMRKKTRTGAFTCTKSTTVIYRCICNLPWRRHEYIIGKSETCTDRCFIQWNGFLQTTMDSSDLLINVAGILSNSGRKTITESTNSQISLRSNIEYFLSLRLWIIFGFNWFFTKMFQTTSLRTSEVCCGVQEHNEIHRHIVNTGLNKVCAGLWTGVCMGIFGRLHLTGSNFRN